MNEKHTVRVAVYALIIKDKKILLLLRKNTGWQDGNYGLPSGHLEKGETIKKALIRELIEEVKLSVEETNLSFYHVMHRNEIKDKNYEYVDFFFKVEYWAGEPVNAEPAVHGGVKWFDLDQLPENIVPNIKAAIEHFKAKIGFSEFP